MLNRFLEGFGNLQWLAEKGLVKERMELAGNHLNLKELENLGQGLKDHPMDFSKHIYEQGLLVPKGTLKLLRERVRRKTEK
jgi:hypothetical protein